MTAPCWCGNQRFNFPDSPGAKELGVNLRDLLQKDEPEALHARITAALAGKPKGHRLHEQISGDTRHLAQFGG